MLLVIKKILIKLMQCVGEGKISTSSGIVKRISSSLPKKLSQTESINLNDDRQEGKLHRIAMHCFFQNINNHYGKAHKDVLG